MKPLIETLIVKWLNYLVEWHDHNNLRCSFKFEITREARDSIAVQHMGKKLVAGIKIWRTNVELQLFAIEPPPPPPPRLLFHFVVILKI